MSKTFSSKRIDPLTYIINYYRYKERDEERIKYILSLSPGNIVIRKNGDRHSPNPFKHPDVALYHKFLLDVWEPKFSDYSVLMPCTQIKPYRKSITHRMMISYINSLRRHNCLVELYSISEPMIIVPYEYEELYPLANYDFPPKLMEKWEKELMANLLSKALVKIVKRTKYEIIAVLPRHHKSILERSLVFLSGEMKEKIIVIDYGRLAFKTLRHVYDMLFKKCGCRS